MSPTDGTLDNIGRPKGDPDYVYKMACVWNEIADEVRGAFNDVTHGIAGIDWVGEDATAFTDTWMNRVANVDSFHEAMGGVIRTLQSASEEIRTAQESWKENVVGTVIENVVLAGLTFGSGWVIEALADVGLAVQEASIAADFAGAYIGRYLEFMQGLGGATEAAGDGIVTLGEALKTPTGAFFVDALNTLIASDIAHGAENGGSSWTALTPWDFLTALGGGLGGSLGAKFAPRMEQLFGGEGTLLFIDAGKLAERLPGKTAEFAVKGMHGVVDARGVAGDPLPLTALQEETERWDNYAQLIQSGQFGSTPETSALQQSLQSKIEQALQGKSVTLTHDEGVLFLASNSPGGDPKAALQTMAQFQGGVTMAPVAVSTPSSVSTISTPAHPQFVAPDAAAAGIGATAADGSTLSSLGHGRVLQPVGQPSYAPPTVAAGGSTPSGLTANDYAGTDRINTWDTTDHSLPQQLLGDKPDELPANDHPVPTAAPTPSPQTSPTPGPGGQGAPPTPAPPRTPTPDSTPVPEQT